MSKLTFFLKYFKKQHQQRIQHGCENTEKVYYRSLKNYGTIVQHFQTEQIHQRRAENEKKKKQLSAGGNGQEAFCCQKW